MQCKKTRSKEKDQIGERNSESFDKKKPKKVLIPTKRAII